MASQCTYIVKEPDEADNEESPPVVLDDKQIWDLDIFHALSAIKSVLNKWQERGNVPFELFRLLQL